MEVRPADEGRHPPGSSPTWAEYWHLDHWTPDGSLGGSTRLTLLPNAQRAWFWSCLVGEGRALVAVVDHEAPLPRPPGLELRTSGLWIDLIAQVPFDHMTLGLEAFGVALDDPTENYRSGWGDRTPLGLDLEWETEGSVAALGASGHHVPCRTHGEVLVGPERIDVDGPGHRSHEWGDLPALGRWSCVGRLDDGTAFAAYDGGVPSGDLTVVTELDLILGGRLVVSSPELDLEIEPVAHAPVLQPLGPGGGELRRARALCRFVARDGRRGAGWLDVGCDP